MSCSDIMCVYVFAYVEAVPLTCYLKNSTEFQLFLEQDLQLRPSIVQQIMAATVDSSKVRRRGREREREGEQFHVMVLGQVFTNLCFDKAPAITKQ